MTDLEKARDYFSGDRFATENGCIIEELGDDYACCSLPLAPHHKNAMGNIMGGAVFMLADFAFAVASNFGKKPTVSTTSQITFLKAPKGSVLYARAEALREGRTGVYYEVTVTDDLGTLIARVTASGAIVG